MNIYENKLNKLLEFNEELSKSTLKGPWSKAWDYMDKAKFAQAPASTRFHLSVRGGLLIHSVSVTELALKFLKVLPIQAPRAHVIAAGLIHDIGKCGLVDEDGKHMPVYHPNPKYSSMSTAKWNVPYEYQDPSPAFSVRDLSALLAARWEFPWEVIQAVLIHDGQYDPANTALSYKGGGSPLAGLITIADCYHAQQLEQTRGIVPMEE